MMAPKESKFIRMAEVLPNNATTAKILKEREEIKLAKEERDKALKQAHDKEERDRKKERDKAAKEKERRDKAAMENAKKEAEQQEESKRLDGRMLIFLNNCKNNQTPGEYSMSGLELGGPRTQIIAKIMAYNGTLTTLHLCRKGIQDKEGQDLARALLTNKTLRKLELEGNCLGLQTAKAFALALKKNTTLRYLDLESNNLSHESEESAGVEEMIKALAENTSLLSINLANNKLDEQIGRQFVDLFSERRFNQRTIIDFEFGFNQFRLEETRQIQDYLRRNKADYDKERLREWKERKQMGEEDQKLQKFYLEQETQEERDYMEEEAKSTHTREIEKMWKAMTMENAEEKKRVILQLMEAAEIRASRGKKKKKRGGKKGKKK